MQLGQDRSKGPGKRRLGESSGRPHGWKGKQWAGSGLAIKVELEGLAEDRYYFSNSWSVSSLGAGTWSGLAHQHIPQTPGTLLALSIYNLTCYTVMSVSIVISCGSTQAGATF